MSRLAHLLAALLFPASLGLGCPAGPPPDDPPVCETPLSPDASGRCVPLLATEACPAGSSVQMGTAGCVPRGRPGCPDGFRPDASGWGCRAVISPLHCEGATRERIGDADCVPVGDCAAEFPPADATHFVDAGFEDGALDGTRQRRLADLWPSLNAGAVVAIERGTYAEPSLDAPVDLRIVGRCPAEVVLRPSDGIGGFTALEGVHLSLSGLTLSEMNRAFFLEPDARGELLDVVVSESRRFGITASHPGASLLLDSVVVRDTLSTTEFDGVGLLVGNGASLVAREVSLLRNHHVGLVAGGLGSRVELEGLVSRATSTDAGGNAGDGASFSSGVTASLERVALLANAGVGIKVTTSARLDARSVDVVGPHPTEGNPGGGVRAASGGELVLNDVWMSRPRLTGLSVDGEGTTVAADGLTVHSARPADGVPAAAVSSHDGAQVSLTDAALVDALGVGLLVSGGRVEANGVVVSGTGQPPVFTGGFGVFVGSAGRLEARDLVVGGSTIAGIIVVGEGSQMRLVDAVVLSRVGGDGSPQPKGLIAADGAYARLETSALLSQSAEAVLVSAAAGALGRSYLADNRTALHVQEGTVLREVTSVTGEVSPLELRVDSATRFVDNDRRLGGGVVPLPALEVR